MKKPSREYIRYFFILVIGFLCISGMRLFFAYREIALHIDNDVEDSFSVFENRILNTYEERIRDLVYTRDLTEQVLQSGMDYWQIEEIYYEFSKAMGLYDQIRYLDRNGNERVRVNYAGGNPKIVSRNDLQNKAERYYFQETIKLNHAGIYLSPLDLNVEHGEIEFPYKPMIRLGMQVEDQNGNPNGVVILNYLAQNWIESENREFENYRDHIIDLNQLWIVNPEGYFLQHQDPNQEWGFMISGREEKNFSKLYPTLWAEKQAVAVVRDKTEDAIVYMKKIPGLLPQPPYQSQAYELGYLIAHMPAEEYSGYFRSIWNEGAVWLGLSIFIAFLGAYFWENSTRSRKELMNVLHRHAYRDELTGLLNKAGFERLVPNESKRWNGGTLALGYFDIDDFKAVNDDYGHAIGDEVLKEVGRRLQEVLRERDLPARIHGDEFNILLKLRKEMDANVVARRLINRMQDPIETTAGLILVTVSMGIAFIHENEDLEEVAERADRLMYEVKRTGKSDYRIEGLAPEA